MAKAPSTRVIVRLIFWGCNLAFFYTWALYPAILKLLTSARRSTSSALQVGDLPSVSIVMVVHNEEVVIDAAMQDMLALDYPPDQIEFIVVSDGSTDSTEDRVRFYATRDSRIRLLPAPRGGLTAGVVQGVAMARNDVVVRMDADTRHRRDYLFCLLRHYQDPRVGGVTGSFGLGNVDATGITRNEGLYWKFEMFLRKAESDLGILSTSSGAVLSFRRRLFEPFSPIYSEDVVIPKLVVKKGYRFVQDRAAVAWEAKPPTIQSELRARRRMVAKGVVGIFSDKASLSALRHPGHWVAILSHKLMRWCTPLFLAGSFAGALASAKSVSYRLAAAAHVMLYASAGIGFWLERRHRQIRVFSAPFSFCLANLGFLLGLLDALRGRRISAHRPGEGAPPG